MLPTLQFIAVLATSLFAGAAIYINLVEHPARMGCSTEIAVAVWAPSYQRATVMQASLAVGGGLAGLGAWLLGVGPMWALGALLILAVVPVTLVVIFPTNKRLLEPARDPGSAETRTLLLHWGRLHAMRSVLSLLACFVFVGELVAGT